MSIHPDASGRDPVAIAIETLLVEMQSKGMGAIYKKSTPEGVVLAFGDIRAEGRTLDLALVRLENTMMDHEKIHPAVDRSAKAGEVCGRVG